MNSRNFLIIALITLGGLLLQSCGSESKVKETEKADVSVAVGIAKLTNQAETMSFSGKLEAENHSNLSTRIMGQIAKIKVETGQKVNKGQVLVEIHAKDIQAKKAQVKANELEAKAAFTNAKKDYDRFTVLFEQKSASQKELDDVTTQYNMAKARLEAVKEMGIEVEEMLRYTTIKAPYNGVITRKYMNEGDLASPGMPLVAIEKQGEFMVMARIPESEISKIKQNDPVLVQISALGNVKIHGFVSEVNPSSQYTGNQFEAKIVLKPTNEQKNNLYSGMYANVLIEKGGVPSIMIPESVLIHKGQLTGIYTVSQGGTAILRWLRLGKTIGDQVEILSGLNDGEKYIISFKGKIWDGAKLTIQ
ncbi:efflux RND transporter periplasmic adaptor subunit [Labilibaculum sp. K2S]|uniref:efflux RND transporter periplasmic adaptor subunit n=1 Tax=Labilibaculum sp. K2S TaxID=3056386 RepID=UPI0025A41355|nr:efflux RND transporter periplasmic adaptor subunit [Labilibaculum sp. K2S]MDM8161887.1 efflux RND transporter periplasmic adaptor subunit [Labilibaculum sp. K2S]